MGNDRRRPKARLPRGFADRGAADIRRVADMMETIRGVYERWGFEPVETPLIEYADALGKFLPDQDRPNEGVFAFQDDDEQWLSLRYDLTAPLARMVAQDYERLPKPYKSYRAGWVFRNEKPGPGRFRQFMQFDADIVGSASPLADAEICMIAADVMEALGFLRGEYLIRVNSRRLLDGIMSVIGIAPDDDIQRLSVLRAFDKLDRLGPSGVADLLGQGRRDESGDITPGCGLDPEQTDVLLAFLEADVSHNPSARLVPREDPTLADMKGGIIFQIPSAIHRSRFAEAFISSGELKAGFEELDAIRLCVEQAGYGEDRILTAFSVVRGLEYYTGAVFEAEIMFETVDDTGRPQRFGSVGGGGRYDGLVGRFRGENVPATGFSVGVSRLAAALAARDKTRQEHGPVLVTVMDRAEVGRSQALTAKLRAALNPRGARPVPVEMYIGESGMKAQLKYADRRNAPCVIIEGSDERARQRVQVKDLALGKQAAETIGSREDWVAARPAQQEVPYDGEDVSHIVAAIRAIIG